MAFKLLIKKSTNALSQSTLDLGELGLRYTVDGSSNVTGGQLYVGLGTTNGTGYFAIANADHTHTLTSGLLKGGSLSYAPWGDAEYAAGRLYSGTTNPTETTRLNYDGYFYATKVYSGGSEVLVASNIKTISTDNTTAQIATADESITGSGTIELHKIAKTGTYSDLIGTPTIGNGALTLQTSAGSTNTAITIGTGTGFTANATGNSTYDIDVGPALTNLATTMAGTGAGFLRKSAADTYSLDTNTYVVANSAITTGTFTKVTVDAKGLVTAGTTLSAGDIPNLDAAKITSGTFSADRIPTLDLATKTSGTLAVGRGGTGATTLTAGNLLVGNGTSAITAPYSVETTLTGSTTAIPRADAVKTYIDGFLSASDAMVFKGTLGTGGTITALPTTYSAGWAYKVITAGTYAGIVTEIGDLIIAVVDRAGTGNLNSDWTVVQTNLDGAVIGPSSAVSANFASFNGTTGKLIADSGFNSSSFALAGHTHTYLQLTDTPANYTTITGDGTAQTEAPYTYSNTLVGINLARNGLVNVASLDCGTW